MTTVRAYQIYYSEQTRSTLDADFEPLDNTSNERSDWFEYWPIRRYLHTEPMRDDCLYGFLSPNFRAKTGLSGAQVRGFAAQFPDADVITFSPLPCHAACFLNVFEQAEFTQPGFLDVAAAYFRAIGANVEIPSIVNHSRNSVLSNYFLARPMFWRRWAAAADRLYRSAEDRASSVYEPLNRNTPYLKDDGVAKPAQMKVFVLERLATLVIGESADLRVVNYPPFELPMASYFTALRAELIRLDELKIEFARTGAPVLLREYRALQDSTLAAAQRALLSERAR